MERYILSLDIGSSSCKAVLFNGIGDEIASAKGEYPLHYLNQQAFVEQKPDELMRGVIESIHQLHQLTSLTSKIDVISLCAQISSHFLIDHQNQPLMNIITWMDNRAAVEAEEMEAAFSMQELVSYLGADIPTGPSWPIPKLRWIAKSLPHLLEKAKYFIQPKDWILWKLTNRWCTDLSSLRGIVHQSNATVCKPLLQWAGVHSQLVPPICSPFEIVGTLHQEAADLLNLPIGVPVVLGWNDLNASVLGTVGIQTGVHGFDITGTSEHIGVIQSQGSLNDSGLFGINRVPFLESHQLDYGVTSSGGQALKWYVENIDQLGETRPDYSAVIEQAAAIDAGANGLLFIPYLNGERSPWWDPFARGVIFGLHFTHDRRHLARAVLEGVGFALRAIYDRIDVSAATIRISGGSSRLPLWNQIKADILGTPLIPILTADTGCLGAAILAAYGAGWYSSLAEASSSMIRTGSAIEPNRENQAVYDERYHDFINLYQTTKSLSKNRR